MEATVRLAVLHDRQQEIINTHKRFNLLKCGRRFGKTALMEDIACNAALDGQYVGYWSPTYKDLYEVWQNIKAIFADVIKRKDESVKQIELITGGKIDFWSLEDSDNGRGRKYHLAIVDEAEKCRNLEQAMNGTIIPTLADYAGDLWVVSSPKFGYTYFKKLFAEKSNDEAWQTWRFTTYDNPYIPKEEIDFQKTVLPKPFFDCEYLAMDVDLVAMPFMYNFNTERHVKETVIRDDVPLRFIQDFNVNPMATIVCQIWVDKDGHHVHFVREHALYNQGTREMIQMIKQSYTPRQLAAALWTGDATSRKRTVEQTIKQSQHLTSWVLIDQSFNLGRRLQIPRSNPPVAETRDLCNFILAVHPDVRFDPAMKLTINELKYTQVDDEGDLLKSNRKDERQRSDFLDNVRYCFDTWLNDFMVNTSRYGIKQ